jgi:hypothetical protein
MRTFVLIICAVLLAVSGVRSLHAEQPAGDEKLAQEIAKREKQIQDLKAAFEKATDEAQKKKLIEQIEEANKLLLVMRKSQPLPKADADKTIEEKLKRKVSFEFVDTPLQDAIAFIRSLTNITIVVDPKVLASQPAPISLRVTDMQLDLALEWICRLAAIKATPLDNVLYLAPVGQQAPEWMPAFEQQLTAPAEEWQAELAKRMSRKVAFEFIETPFAEAIAFLNQLTKVNIILDPKSLATGIDKTPVTLRVTDISMSSALKWMCVLAGAKCELRNQALFVSSFNGPQTVIKEAKARVETAGPPQPARVQVRLPNGVELELEGAAAFESTVVRDVIEQSADPARDGMLIYSLKTDLVGITLEDLKTVLAKTSPTAKLEVLEKFDLLLISTDNVAELRRAAVVVRKLRAPKAAPEPVEKREVPAPPIIKTVKPPPAIKPLQKATPAETPKGEF